MSTRDWRRDIEVVLPRHVVNPDPDIESVPPDLLADLGRLREGLRWRDYSEDMLELAVTRIEELRDRDPRAFAWAREDLVEIIYRFLLS